MPVYSHSRISSFENCPLQYRYRYVDRLKREVEGVEAFVGKVVHEVLEDLYDDLDHARAAGAPAFTSRYNETWRKRLSPSVRIVRENMMLEDYRALGERCVELFYTRNHPFEGATEVKCEERVEFSLDAEGRYRMLGFVDRIDRIGSDVIEIHDYKTGSLPRSGALKTDRQLTLYEIALRDRYPGVKQFRHIWHYLAHDKKFIETRTADDLRKIRLNTINAIRKIEDTAEFPAKQSALCGWCEYQAICPEWEGRVPQRALPAPRPEADPRTGQYNLFSESPGK